MAKMEGRVISQRGQDWIEFAEEVLEHIENYTIPQYGDKGKDPVTKWTDEDCLRQVDKYLKRRGRNSRQDQDKLDLLKSAHFIQIGSMKADEKEDVCSTAPSAGSVANT